MNGRRLTPAKREERIKVAREHGLTVAVESSEQSIDALVVALRDHFAGKP